MLESAGDFPPPPVNEPEILDPEVMAAMAATMDKAVRELSSYIYGTGTPYAAKPERHKREVFRLQGVCGQMSMILQNLKNNS